MARLFIIDQSLKSPGGHHFDYTSLLAKAAVERGCETIIATHRKFKHHRLLPDRCEIRGTFRQTTYSSLSHFRRLMEAGLAEDRSSESTRPSGALREAIASHRKIGFKSKWLEGRINKQASRFAADLRSLFRNCHFQPTDQVFFTTVSEIELQGLAEFLNSTPKSEQAAWHAQFHFSLYAGRTPDYDLQHSLVAPTANRIRQTLKRINRHRLHLYATSDALAEQFSLIEVNDVQELTYPVTTELTTRQERKHRGERRIRGVLEQEALHVTCAGGVREEKGSGKLNELASLLWPDFLANQRIRFHVQRRQRSSLRTQQLDLSALASTLPVSVDQDDLESAIQFVKHPLPTDEYHELIRNTDVGMLLYDSRTYFSRRAGVLGEYLTAGVPVIVPAGCWLSEQLAEPNFAYADNLVIEAQQSGRIANTLPYWNQNAAAKMGQVVVGDRDEIQPTCVIPTSGNSSGLVLQFDFVEPLRPGYFLRIHAQQLDRFGNESGVETQVVGRRKTGASNSVFIRLDPSTFDVKLRLSNAYEDSLMLLSQIQVHQLTDTSAQVSQRPLGAVGLIADGFENVPNLLNDMLENHRHYRETAERYSGEWFDRHDPAQTLKDLFSRSSAATPGLAAA